MESNFSFAKSETQKNIESIQDELIKTLATVKTLASSFESMKKNGIQDRNELSEVLRNILEKNPDAIGAWTVWEPNALDGKDAEYANTEYHDATGRFIPYWNRGGGRLGLQATGPTYQDKGEAGYWYTKSKDTRDVYISEPSAYNLQGQQVMLVSVTAPIIYENRVLGVVGMDIALDRMQKIVGEISLLDTGYAQLISSTGTIVGHRDRDLVGKNSFELFGDYEINDAIEKGESIRIPKKAEGNLVRRYLIVEPMKLEGLEKSWILMSILPHEEIFKDLNRSVVITIIVATIGMLILGLGILLITNSISKPIIDLSAIIDRVANYDLSYNENSKVTVYLERQDEIGILGRSLQNIINNLREIITRVGESSEQVASASEELSASTEETSASIEEVASTTNEFASTVQVMSTNVGQMVETAEQIQSSAHEGTNMVNQAVALTNSLKDSMGDISEVVANLGVQSREIGQIIEVITGIAEQTNLLALNAAIEAARAGEHGRGFAVVADEVRYLAEQSAQSTTQIEELIKNIQDETERTILGINRGVEEADESATVVAQSGELLSSILGQIDAVTNLIIDVSKGIEMVSSGSEELSATTEEQSAAIESIAISAQELSQMSAALQELVLRFKLED